MAVSGVGGGGGSVSGSGKGNSAGSTKSGNCSTSVNNDGKTKTTTATKSCGIGGFHSKTGIDTSKYAADKLSKTLDDKAKKTATNDVKPAKNGTHYKVQSGIKVTSKVEAKMAELGKKVFDKTGRKVTFSSGYRSPKTQAAAMYDKVAKNKGSFNEYRQKDLAKEIQKAYLTSPKNREKAVEAMSKVIEKQVANGKFISDHLRSNAVDISSVDEKYYPAIKDIVMKEMNGKMAKHETTPIHLHIEF